MGSLSWLTGAGAVTTTASTIVDFKEKKIKKEGVDSLVGAIVSTAATAVAGATMNHMTMKEIHEKYASAYVESMSDEELEQALTQMDLLEAQQATNDEAKTR